MSYKVNYASKKKVNIFIQLNYFLWSYFSIYRFLDSEKIEFFPFFISIVNWENKRED